MSGTVRVDDINGLRALADTLPETPETVISIHLLRRGLCRAYSSGPTTNPTALVIDTDEVPGEPTCYGDDVDALWQILRELPGWFAANLRVALATTIGATIEREWREPVSYLGDIYFTLQRPAPSLSDPTVRLLSSDDLPMLTAAPGIVRGGGFGSPAAILADGIVAAAVIDDAIAAIAHTSAISDRYADIGVATLPAYRGRGLATVAASLVATGIQQLGRTPVWSCGETNQASLRVAAKLGFKPVQRRVYVIVDSRRNQ